MQRFAFIFIKTNKSLKRFFVGRKSAEVTTRGVSATTGYESKFYESLMPTEGIKN